MATKAKDSNNSLRKEKKASPSSTSHTAYKAVNRKPAGSTEKDKDESTSGKSVPNYLRPTFSSRSESLKLGKKTLNEEQKLVRRRSFDRPPSAIGAQKSLISPDPKDRVPNRNNSRIHYYRPVFERNSKSLKPVRPQKQQQQGTIITRSKSLSKNAHSSKIPNIITSPHQDLDVHFQTKQQTDEESQVNVEAETVLDSQLTDGDEDENCEISQEELLEVEDDNNIIGDEEGDHQEKEERDDNQLADNSKIEMNEEEEEKKLQVKVNSSEAVEETKNIEKREKLDEDEDEDEDEDVVELGVEEGNGAIQKNQGKKESPAAYNDVIEETKNKLLEKRKNKVKALVGAFETVIDYETAAGSNK